jgi:hypothetical protein
MIVFCDMPIMCVVKDEEGNVHDGYLLYVESGGTHSNDIWTIIHCNGGIIRHYSTKQVRISKNLTFDIKKQE